MRSQHTTWAVAVNEVNGFIVTAFECTETKPLYNRQYPRKVTEFHEIRSV